MPEANSVLVLASLVPCVMTPLSRSRRSIKLPTLADKAFNYSGEKQWNLVGGSSCGAG